MKYTLSLEAILDYTMMCIMAGDLYLIDEKIESRFCAKWRWTAKRRMA